MKNEKTLGAKEGSSLEDRIIAHFDGSLDASSSKALMDEVMANPEKRALFRAHETLDRVIASARVPMEAPIETRREIAEKIPGLLAFLPGLIGTVETAPIIQQSLNPFLAFFSRMSLTTAVSIGSAVAVLTTVGIIATHNTGNNSHPAPTRAYVQPAVPSITPQNDAIAPTASGIALKSRSSNAIASKAIASNSLSSSATHRVASTIRTVRTKLANVNERANVKSNASQNIPNNNIADNMDVPSTPAASDNDRSINDRIAPGSEPVTPVPPIANPNLEPKPAAPIAANMPMQRGIMTEIPDEVGQGITVRPYVSYGSTAVWLNGINEQKAVAMPSATIGLEFDLGDRWMARVQGGRGPFAEIIPVIDHNQQSIPSLIGSPINIYGPGMVPSEAGWATVGMSYSFQTSIAPIIVGGNAGAALTSPNTGILGMGSLGTEFEIAGRLALQPTLNFNVVEMSTNLPLSSVPNNGLYEGANKSSMWASSFGFQLNFVYRP